MGKGDEFSFHCGMINGLRLRLG